MRRYFVLMVIAALFSDAFSQSWESVRNNDEYLCGEGRGLTEVEAKQRALDDLISKIAVNVSIQSNSSAHSTNKNGSIDETSQFSQTIKTFSQATLTNTQYEVLEHEPDAKVAIWIKKSEMEKIFELRERKAKDMVRNAVKNEEKGNVDFALRNYYWALMLLNSLQYPNAVEYEGHVLTNWIKERMGDVFRNISVSYVGDDRLWITYKGKGIGGIDFEYWDGTQWTPEHAKDGDAQLELPPKTDLNTIQLRFEYQYRSQSQIDKEVESVMNVVKRLPIIPNNELRVSLDGKAARKRGKEKAKAVGQSFSAVSTAMLTPPKPMGKEADDYASVTGTVIKGIQKKEYLALEKHFTPEGWDMFNKLIRYGQAKVVDCANLRFYEYMGLVEERGLKMSFAFRSGVVRNFVEDVVLSFNKEKKIVNIAFGLGRTAEDDILNKGVWKEESRFILMNLLENYKTAYALKRMDYIASIFDDDAVIITGTVIKKASNSVNVENRSRISSAGNQIIRKNRQTKKQYLENLKRCFERNEFVNIHFTNNDVRKLEEKWGEAYAIQIAQDYCSSTYGDQGYLMLYVDINNPGRPMIKLRTWQPEKDPEFGLYGPGHF